jgi:hypothetical protein
MATTQTIEITRYGYSDNPVHDRLIKELADLAGSWREFKSDEIAFKYQTVLRSLIYLDFNDDLPVDVELPDELMPAEYTSLFS